MTLDENDFLTYQLYTASKSPRVKKGRIRGWILTTVTFGCAAYLFYTSNNEFLGNYFLGASGLSLTLYPLYSRWRYKKHYKKHVQDTLKNRFGVECAIQINEDTISTKDKTGEAMMNLSEIEEVNEIRDFFFIKMKTGESLIISKIKSGDPQDVVNEIKSLVERKGIKHNIELDWKWR
jgi:hypothetical protein